MNPTETHCFTETKPRRDTKLSDPLLLSNRTGFLWGSNFFRSIVCCQAAATLTTLTETGSQLNSIVSG